MVKVSVIIPVYNTEQYLESCLNSIIKQSLKEIEIICIDDKSTDNSLVKLKEIAKTDKRINIIANEKNYGAGISRNFGLKISCGEYIHFVDSDDYLELNALEELYEQAKHRNIDIYFHKMQIILPDGINSWGVSEGITGTYPGCYGGTELLSLFVEQNDFFYYPWAALFSRELLISHNCFFKSLLIGEGGEFVLHALIFAKSVMVSEKKYYNYFINSSSITQSNKDRIVILLGSIVQYITVLKNVIYFVDDKAVYKYLKYKHNNISNNIINLSYNETEQLKKEMHDEFSKFILWEFLYKNESSKIAISEQCNNLLLEYKKVILYGAGNIVKTMLNIFNKYDIVLQGIAVSDKRNNPENLYGHSVYEISELKQYAKECLVIVALKKKYHKNVNELLEKYSFKNVFFIDIDFI